MVGDAPLIPADIAARAFCAEISSRSGALGCHHGCNDCLPT
jgi:hypothetical protein